MIPPLATKLLLLLLLLLPYTFLSLVPSRLPLRSTWLLLLLLLPLRVFFPPLLPLLVKFLDSIGIVQVYFICTRIHLCVSFVKKHFLPAVGLSHMLEFIDKITRIGLHG
jgi:hypothetical protein